MTDRKFFKKIVTIEFLSQDPIPDGMGIEGMVFEAREGDYSMAVIKETDVELDGKQAADALLEQGSDPMFFQLTENGDDE